MMGKPSACVVAVGSRKHSQITRSGTDLKIGHYIPKISLIGKRLDSSRRCLLGNLSRDAGGNAVAGAIDVDVRGGNSVLAVACHHFNFDGVVDAGAERGFA